MQAIHKDIERLTMYEHVFRETHTCQDSSHNETNNKGYLYAKNHSSQGLVVYTFHTE